MSSAPSPYKKSAGSRNRPSGQELDPSRCERPYLCLYVVDLLCSADGSDSTTESSQVSGKQRGKLKHTPDGERHSSSE